MSNVKKLLSLLMAVAAGVLWLTGCQQQSGTDRLLEELSSLPNYGDTGLDETKNEAGYLLEQQPEGEFRAVWITFSELAVQDPAFTAEQYTQKIAVMMENLKNLHINAVFVHMRAFGDAFYPSALFPWSAYLSGTQGVPPAYDPLAIILEQAHARSIAVHAWLNPYRISNSADPAGLAEGNPAKVWLQAGNNTNVLTLGNGLYYNPASTEAQNLIIRGVRELVDNYDLQGIHFDDYFYPSTDETMDAADYTAYQQQGGQLDRTLWRRANVSAMIMGVYNTIRESGKQVSFGVSVSADIARNLNALYADVKTWGSQPGYVDYICPQIYFGFEHTILPFEKTLQDWESIITSDQVAMYTGLAVYKSGNEDVNAGPEQAEGNSPRYEWINHSDILERQIKRCRESGKNTGLAFFSYSYLCHTSPNENLKNEVTAAAKMLQ